MFDFLGPFSLIIFFAAGAAIGVTVFPLKWLKINSWVQLVGISLTLFSMGATMGGSASFLSDLRTVGVQALLYAVVTIVCSVALVWALSRLALRKGGEEQ